MIATTFAVSVEEDVQDGGFVAEVVGIPGCMSQGPTPHEAARNALAALCEIRGA